MKNPTNFGWIDYSDCSFAVNYGKYGSIGKFELKEFDTTEDCQKEAEKLIRSKIKKGYVEDENFNFLNRLYIDSEEYGLNPQTSHPRFPNILTMKYIIREAMKMLRSEVMRDMIR